MIFLYFVSFERLFLIDASMAAAASDALAAMPIATPLLPMILPVAAVFPDLVLRNLDSVPVTSVGKYLVCFVALDPTPIPIIPSTKSRLLRAITRYLSVFAALPTSGLIDL
jgi:hypothetical protein